MRRRPPGEGSDRAGHVRLVGESFLGSDNGQRRLAVHQAPPRPTGPQLDPERRRGEIESAWNPRETVAGSMWCLCAHPLRLKSGCTCRSCAKASGQSRTGQATGSIIEASSNAAA